MNLQDPNLLIPIRDVPDVVRELTSGRVSMSKSKAYRWISRGNRGVKLRRCYVGRIACTRLSWLQDCINATEVVESEPSTDEHRDESPVAIKPKDESEMSHRELATRPDLTRDELNEELDRDLIELGIGEWS